jgi:hypothetical protein
MANRNEIFTEISVERERQRSLKWGGNTDKFDAENSMNDWVAYITTYAGRATNAMRNLKDSCEFRPNMIKVAALAVAAIEAYDKIVEENNG